MIKNGYKIKSSISIKELILVLKHNFTHKNYHPNGDVHNYPEILYVLNGTANITVDNDKFVLNEGDLFIYAPNSYHKRTCPYTATGLIVSFRINYGKLNEYYNKVIHLNRESRAFFISLMEEALNTFSFVEKSDEDSILQPNKGASSEDAEIIKKKLETFILMLSKQVSPVENHTKTHGEILTIIKNFDDNIGNNYSNAELAKLNSISESKLKYLFRTNFDTSPYAYFQEMKIEHAKNLLLEGNKNITEIAEMLGFQSIHYFSRFFKKHIGVSPREYAKSQKTDHLI